MMTEQLIKTRYRLFMPRGAATDGLTIDNEVMWPEQPSYEKLRMLIEPLLYGAFLEHVSVLADYAGGEQFVPSDMFVDEMGMVKGLPRNEVATTIYRRNWLKHHPGADPETIPFIAGPAVLFDRKVWF